MTGQIATRARELILEVCVTNYIDIVSGSLSPDHVHLLISVPPAYHFLDGSQLDEHALDLLSNSLL